MPRGDVTKWIPYFGEPVTRKPLEEIYADFDAFTHELFEDDERLAECIIVRVVLPPLAYEGLFLKGILFTMGADFLIQRYPFVQELFHVIANPMSISYPWSSLADGYFVSYKNPHRERWYKKQYPERAKKVYLPFEEAEYINENLMAPVAGVEKDIDILCVSRLENQKNITLLAKALRIYRQKFDQPIQMTLVTGCDFDEEYNGLGEHAKWQLQEAKRELGGDLTGYINLISRNLPRYEAMPQYYSRSRLFVLGALMEMRNRSLHEAMSCNVPVVCFKDFNRYSRGKELPFPEGAGLFVPSFDAEALADTIMEAYIRINDFKPRRTFLQHFGRRRFLNRCIDSFHYYFKSLPEYRKDHHHENIWLELAVQENYQMSLYNFIYAEELIWTNAPRLPKVDEMMDLYFHKFKQHCTQPLIKR